MSKFRKIKVKDLYKETDDCSVITLDMPADLAEEYKFRQGQHLIFRVMDNGEDIRRTYSLCSSPTENEWKVAVKKIPEGRFSSMVETSLQPGDLLEVMAPSGNFGVDINPDKAKNYLFFAAGSGITPILSMIKTHLALEPKSTCKLFYVNRTAKSIIFKEELEQLRNKYFGRLEIYYFLTKERRDIDLFNGRFDDEKMEVLISTLKEMVSFIKVWGALIIAGISLLVAIISLFKSSKAQRLQNKVNELELKIKQDELDKITKEKEDAELACVEARFITVGKGKHRLKVWNSGNATAYHVSARFDGDVGIMIMGQEKQPFEELEARKSYELILITHNGSASKFRIITEWTDSGGKQHTKTQMGDFS